MLPDYHLKVSDDPFQIGLYCRENFLICFEFLGRDGDQEMKPKDCGIEITATTRLRFDNLDQAYTLCVKMSGLKKEKKNNCQTKAHMK